MDDSVAWVRLTYGTTTQIFSLEYSYRVWDFLEVGLSSSTQLRIYPDASPIGVRVGKRFFGYFEPFCFGARGVILQAGLGYKF